MIAPSDTIILKQWEIWLSEGKHDRKQKKLASIGKRRFLCIESYHMPELETERMMDKHGDEEDSKHNKICIVIRKSKKTSEYLHALQVSKEISKNIKQQSTPKYTLDLFDLEIEDERNLSAESIMSIVYKQFTFLPVTMHCEGMKQKQLIIFARKTERDDFCKTISKYKEETLRFQRERFLELAQSKSFTPFVTQQGLADDYDSFSKTKTNFLVEIVGVEDLPQNCDSFVEVRMLDRVVHRTKVIPNEDNPIWTLRTGSYFILTINAEELLRCNDGIHFIVYDNCSLSEKILGATCVPIYSLYTTHESREEYNLQPYVMGKKPEGSNEGSIAIKFRVASDDDKQFMKKYATLESKAGTSQSNYCPQIKYKTNNRSNASKTRHLWMPQTRKTIVNGVQVKLRKTRPYHDPDRPATKWMAESETKSTKWMTKSEVKTELMRPSFEWIDTGSGQLARIYLEILQCEDLDDRDFGRGIETNKSDPFVQLVYEDCTRRTDVIDNCLFPMWLPWTQRAFILHMTHPSSQIFLGVFDYDKFSNHDFLGRCCIDITHFRPETEYVLDYKLFDTHMMPRTDKQSMGNIKIRIRVEVDDQQALALASLSPPPALYINSFDKKSFLVVSDTVTGTDDLKEYSLEHILTLFEEITSYRDYKQYIIAAFLDLIMWRCAYQFKIPISSLNYVNSFFLKCAVAISPEKICGLQQLSHVSISLPLDSIVMFFCSTTLVENISLLPTYIFFFCGWTLTAVLNWRQNHPDPWYRSIGLFEGLSCLFAGTELEPIQNITPDAKTKESLDKFNEMWEERSRLAHEREAKLVAIARKRDDEIADEMDEFGVDTDLSSRNKKRSPRLGPTALLLKSTLYPHQQRLFTICEWLRFSRNIITWQEYYFSLYISTTCFTVAAISYFIPWAFIFKLAARIVVWSLFGPWIKLGCIYYGTDIKEIFESRMHEMKKLEKHSNILIKNARITHEEALKRRSFKQYLFGAYMVKVPLIKHDRIIRRPLLSSTATAIDSESSTNIKEAIKIKDKDTGQSLVGNMVPKCPLLEH